MLRALNSVGLHNLLAGLVLEQVYGVRSVVSPVALSDDGGVIVGDDARV
jgi:hypothetical protein